MKYIIITIITLISSNRALANNALHRLDKRIIEIDSLVCVGLDPDLEKIPLSIVNLPLSDEEKVCTFLKKVVDITIPYSAAYKIQKAFFDQFYDGHALLKKIVLYIRQRDSSIPIFIDCKIGDIDNTMHAYMNILFEDVAADGVVVNPYMGDDVFEPFIKDRDKIGLVLVQTSNIGAKIVQEIRLKEGKKLWEKILELLITRWNSNKNLIPILSSNVDYNHYVKIRKKIPEDMPIFLAGIGSQGGDTSVVKQLLNKKKRGVLVNSSRSILYPYNTNDKDWELQILNAVVNLRNILNKTRSQK